MSAPVGWGIAGCGWVTRDYVGPAVAEARNGHIVALLDPDAQARDRVAAPGAIRHIDLDAFLDSTGLEAVYVAAPNHHHASITTAATARGLPVMCEKPMAIEVSEAEGMVAAAEHAGVLYATAFNQRFHAAHIRLRQMVSDGVLGTVTLVRIHYACWLPEWWREGDWHLDPATAGGGALFDLAPHGLDLTQFLLDDELESVTALGQSRVHALGVEDGAVFAGRTCGGALLSLAVAYNVPETLPRRLLEVVGTRATAIATDTMGQTAGGRLELVHADDGRREHLMLSPTDDICPFRGQVEAFADAIRGEAPFPVAPARDLVTMRMLHHAQSAIA